MSPDDVKSLLLLAIGFSLAGAIATAYQLATARPLSFRLSTQPTKALALASVPMLVLAAPFIIMRNTLRGIDIEQRRAEFVMLATIIAAFWSLMSGTAVVMALQALGILQA